MKARLEPLGLIVTATEAIRYRRLVFLLFAGPLGVGVVRLANGLAHNRPVLFLVFVLVAGAFTKMRCLSAPIATPAGRELVASYREKNARAARAPLQSELALAVALTGIIVLKGTVYDAVFAQSKAAGGSGCGGGGCGGGCGG
jgi:uncharacterized protein (TIGR04222 family)